MLSFQDIDECSAETLDCSKFSTCTDTPGSYKCTCNPGFSGDGKTCIGNVFDNVNMALLNS